MDFSSNFSIPTGRIMNFTGNKYLCKKKSSIVKRKENTVSYQSDTINTLCKVFAGFG
jgi:translation initiation factor IF-3